MADIDEMHARGVPFRCLVDGQGIAIGGTLNMQQLSSRGMMPICQVDASGVAGDGSTLLQLRSRGIPFFCEVSELGVDPVSGDTNRMLANRGIRGDCMLTENGIAQGGTSTMVELSRRSIDYFCPVTEAGAEGSIGPDITPPVFTTGTTGNNPEDTVLAFTVSTNEATTKVLTGGADLARFELVSGGTINTSHTLRWLANTTKDFEAPDDVGTNNTYVVEVTATDAALNATPQTITITVTNVAPTVTAFSPLDDSTGISPDSNLVVIFNETVQFHTTVVITLRLTSNDSIVETFDETDIGGTLSIVGSTLSIMPTSAMADSTSHYVLIGATSIKDMTGAFFAGIAAKTTWNFTTGVLSLAPSMNFSIAANSQLIAALDDL